MINLKITHLPLCFLLAFGFFSVAIFDTRAEQVPPRTKAVVAELNAEKFTSISSGLSALKSSKAGSVGLIALRIDPSKFGFELKKQTVDEGDRVDDAGRKLGAIVAFNGGFFGIRSTGEKFPVGMLKVEGVKYSHAWEKSGGYLVFNSGIVDILPTKDAKLPKASSVLQSKPNLIEPGGKWAMNTNQGFSKKRTLVCNDDQGQTIVLIIFSGGLSLYEAGWLMRDESVGGFFNCDSALAMDGGGSTQIWVKDHPELSFTGETSVQNLVAVFAR